MAYFGTVNFFLFILYVRQLLAVYIWDTNADYIRDIFSVYRRDARYRALVSSFIPTLPLEGIQWVAGQCALFMYFLGAVPRFCISAGNVPGVCAC